MNTALPADRVRTAVEQFMKRLAPDDRIKLLMFNGVSNPAVDFTNDRAAIDRALRRAAPGGGPGLAETLQLALASTSPPHRRQLVIFVTDGAAGSSATPEVLAVLTQRSRATLTIVMPRPVPAREQLPADRRPARPDGSPLAPREPDRRRHHADDRQCRSPRGRSSACSRNSDRPTCCISGRAASRRPDSTPSR